MKLDRRIEQAIDFEAKEIKIRKEVYEKLREDTKRLLKLNKVRISFSNEVKEFQVVFQEVQMNREDLVQLFDKNKEDIAKYEKNKKRIKDINELIRKKEKEINIKTTTTYKEAQSSPTNKINSAVENFVEQKDEKISKLEEERTELEAENIVIKSRIEDVEIYLKALKFRERTIIIEHYIEGNSYDDIGNRVYWRLFGQTRDGRTVQRIADKAIEKMLKL